MRNLTIKREKSFVGCLAKVKVYIETEADGELTIQNTPCRKIGELKNGEEKTFAVANGARKVFVIIDKLSKELCMDFFLLPDGNGDISLSGKNRFNPAVGNAFVFDGNENSGTQKQRRANTRKGILFLLCVGLLGAVIGFSFSMIRANNASRKAAEPKTFSADGMSVTLTAAFKEAEFTGYTAAFDSRDLAVFVLKEPFTLADGLDVVSILQYADFVKGSNPDLETGPVQSKDGLTYYTYTFLNEEMDITFRYYTYLYKSVDAFWIVQFAMRDGEHEAQESQIESFAKSVTFDA